MIENKVNEWGQKQVINNLDKIIKIENRFLQVRLIRTKKFQKEGFTPAMPRARFIDPKENFYYLVNKTDLIKLKNGYR